MTGLSASSDMCEALGPRKVHDVVLNVVEGEALGLGKWEGGEGGHEHDTRAKTNGATETRVCAELAESKRGEECTALARRSRDPVGGTTNSSWEDLDRGDESHVVGTGLPHVSNV